MLRLDRGTAIEFVVLGLEAHGHRWAYRVMDSRAFSLPKRRGLVCLLAALVGELREIVLSDDVGDPEEPSWKYWASGFHWTEGTRGLERAVDTVQTIKGGSSLGIPSPSEIWLPDGRIATPEIRDAERSKGFKADRTRPAESVAQPSRRWRLVGDAVSVPASEWIGTRLKSTAGATDPKSLARPLDHWVTAAWASRKGRFQSRASACTVANECVPLPRYLHHPPRPLAERATAGFVGRLMASGLRYPPEFLSALENHLSLQVPRRSVVSAG